MVFVNLVGDAALEGDGRELRGAGERHFDGAGAVLLRNGSSWPVSGRFARSFPVTMPSARCLTGASLALAGFPGEYGVAEIEALDRVGEVAHEIAAAEFAVGENFESEFLLFGEDADDVAVLDGAQGVRWLRRLARASRSSAGRGNCRLGRLGMAWTFRVPLLCYEVRGLCVMTKPCAAPPGLRKRRCQHS